MRSLIDEHDAFGRAMLADLTGQDRFADRISEPVAGNSGGPARVVAESEFGQFLTTAGIWMKVRRADGEVVAQAMAPYQDVPDLTYRPYQVTASFDLRATVHAGASEGAGRAFEAGRTVATAESLLQPANWKALMTVWRLQRETVDLIYAAAQSLLTQAGPMPLVSNEPWEESDEAYAKRIGLTSDRMPFKRVQDAFGHHTHGILDGMGRDVATRRARLVPTQQEP